MNFKHLHDSNNDKVVLLAGSIIGSIILLIVMIVSCASCDAKTSKKRNRSSRASERNESNNYGRPSSFVENEYQTPEVTIRTHQNSRETSPESSTNQYMVPKPNIVYTDLDRNALHVNKNITPHSSRTPTEYAVIDHRNQTTTNAQSESQWSERHYGNIGNRPTQEQNIYANRPTQEPTIYANISR